MPTVWCVGVAAVGVVIAAAALRSSLPAHQWWGRIALFGYIVALALTMVPRLRRWWVPVTALACGAVPLAVLVVGRSRGWHHVAQSEVDVLESGARRLLEHLTPYRHPSEMSGTDATTNYSYFPYLPAMTLPGLPAAVFGRRWFTDARIWMVAFDSVVLRVVWHRLQPRSRQALSAIVASPLVTLLAAAGGHDLLVASSLVAGYAGATWALGAGSSLSILAWPLTLPALFVRRFDWRRAVAVAAAVLFTALPVLVAPAAAWANIVDFPAGRTPAQSPADAPSLGRALKALPGGEVLVLLTLAAIGGALALSLLRRPPRTSAAAAGRAAIAFVALVAAVPSTRAGYLIHAVTLGALAWGERSPETTGAVGRAAPHPNRS